MSPFHGTLVAEESGAHDFAPGLVAAERCDGDGGIRATARKGARDLLEWMSQRGEFPPLLLLRRYLKLAISHSEENGIMDLAMDDGSLAGMFLPFALDLIPPKYPAPAHLKRHLHR